MEGKKLVRTGNFVTGRRVSADPKPQPKITYVDEIPAGNSFMMSHVDKEGSGPTTVELPDPVPAILQVDKEEPVPEQRCFTPPVTPTRATNVTHALKESSILQALEDLKEMIQAAKDEGMTVKFAHGCNGKEIKDLTVTITSKVIF